MDIIRGEMFSSGYGFVVDYLAEILHSLRSHDYSQKYKEHFTLSKDMSTRDQDGINKTFSGLMKILYPSGEATKEEMEEILRFAIEGRKRVKDQLMRIDPTFEPVCFGYSDKSGKVILVKTLEEEQYPQYYRSKTAEESTTGDEKTEETEEAESHTKTKQSVQDEPKEKHVTYHENQRGVSFDALLGPYLKNAGKIIVTDPYIRIFFQVRNLMEFLETMAKFKQDEDEVAVHLITVEDDFKGQQQREYFQKIQSTCAMVGIQFSWEYDESSTIHARHIVTDTGWKILLDRGLDIFQHYEMNDAFDISNRLQKFRPCKAFEATYLKVT